MSIFTTQAHYFDGQTSTPHHGKLTLDSAIKELRFAENEHCSLYDVEYEVLNNRMEIKFKNRETSIIVEDKNFINETKNLFNVKASLYQKVVSLGLGTHLLLAVVVVFLIAGVYVSVTPFIAKKAVALLPVEIDVKLGEVFMEKFATSFGKTDSLKTELLNEFASKISWDSRVKLRFHVINSSTINAFALPSGDVVVFTGLLEEIDDYEALAALLSHEVTHVNKRHSMHIICKSLVGYAFISVLTTDVSGLMAIVLENANTLNNLSYSRDMELEADEGGMALLEKNGINQNGMLKLMKILQSVGPNIEVLSTHPIMEKRIKNIESNIKQKEHAENRDLAEIFVKMIR
ncbi:MAG: M48 family metallopeptidase [Fibromonadales bacterium]|nr:M48 family metallopeptidase [Fibromonadales bacterium]